MARLEPVLVQHLGHFFPPETEGAVLFEGGHARDDNALLDKKRHAPLYGFIGVRTRLMHQLAQVSKDWLRERRGFLDVCVYAWVERPICHGWPPCAEALYTIGPTRGGALLAWLAASPALSACATLLHFLLLSCRRWPWLEERARRFRPR